MPTYHVSIINEHFISSNKHECADQPAAWKYAIKGALEIAADQVSNGNPFFGAEVVLKEGTRQIGRYVVSVGASQLKE